MSTFHAIVWLDRSEAHVIMFDREHVETQKIKSRSHHKATGGHVGSHQGMHMVAATAPAATIRRKAATPPRKRISTM